jgi:hypothetical protein
MSMDVKAICESITTAITGLDHAPAVRSKILPITICQKIHSRKLPSCPSQKQEIMYCTGRSRDEWCHA